MHFIATLQDLSSYVSIDDDFVAAPVLAVDRAIMSRQPARRRYQPEHQTTSTITGQKVPVDVTATKTKN